MSKSTSFQRRATETDGELRRDVGLVGAILLGLGSIVGTGVFVSLGVAAGATGPAVIGAVMAAACLALCNGLSSAQLAAAYPVSGGTYEYGYRLLHPGLGFMAGWMFLCAKSASAATAAQGLVIAAQHWGAWELTGLSRRGEQALAAVVVIAVLAWLTQRGIRRSNQVNAVMVGLTLLALLSFVSLAFTIPRATALTRLTPWFNPVTDAQTPVAGFLTATAWIFVAFTGYGRIATLAEEVRQPQVTIPRALWLALALATAVYVAVAAAGIVTVGVADFAKLAEGSVSPLPTIARELGYPGLASLIAAGSITAMLGVLLNLILGLSRVVLAMARRGDLPRSFAFVNSGTGSPSAAIAMVAALIAGLAVWGNLKFNWSLSAFTVLIYYALTNAAAWRLEAEQRQFPRWISGVGFVVCVALSGWIEPAGWYTGLALMALGAMWFSVARWRETRGAE